jgi:isoleucyl-tRNA synthetase
MHKSLGTAIAPEEIIEKYGADMLRLWVASSDYHADVRVSEKLFKQLSDIYLKIRNTARYILGNLDGFEPDSMLPFEDLTELDKWAVSRVNSLVLKARAAFERYEFHLIYHAMHNFCVIDMSSFYLDIKKDRLYCEEKDGYPRRSAQTAMFIILDAMVRMLAPILAFTAEEIWLSMPHRSADRPESVMFNSMAEYRPEYELDEETKRGWERILKLRDDVNKALELARAEKVIGKPLDAEVVLYLADNGLLGRLKSYDLKTLFIVSKVELMPGEGEGYKGEFEGVTVQVKASQAPKCVRCWTHDEAVDKDGLCPRCRSVVEKLC